jgi:HPt (histidine-containing phosphotransfer) domain-containing protein
MKRTLIAAFFVIICTGVAVAQQERANVTETGNTKASAADNGKSLNIQSGTQLAAQLENSLDVGKAKPGDRVVLKTTQAIKENGQTVVNKGAKLVGHVTEVQRSAQARGESTIGLAFDRIESGSLTTPISATITSVTQARAAAVLDDGGFGGDTQSRTTGSARGSARSSSNGGLLGGVGNTVGGVVNSTTDTLGGVTAATGDTVGRTAGGVTRTAGAIRISDSTSASAQGGSTLSLTGDNLRVEKGTTFLLRLDQAGRVGSAQ